MSRVQKLIVVACLGLGLLMPAAAVCAQPSKLQDQIDDHVHKLAAARAAHRTRELVLELMALGYLYHEAGQMQDALNCLNEALPIEQKAHNEVSQAMTLSTLGKVYTDLGQEDKALALFEQALPMWRSVGIQPGRSEHAEQHGQSLQQPGAEAGGPEAPERGAGDLAAPSTPGRARDIAA